MEKCKDCNGCQMELPKSEFWKHTTSADRLQYYCKNCMKTSVRNSQMAKAMRNQLREIDKREQREKARVRQKAREHKCYQCVWGTWIDTRRKYVCMFPSCQSRIVESIEQFAN